MAFIDVTLIEDCTLRHAKINTTIIVGVRGWWDARSGYNPQSELLLAGLPPWSVRVKEDPALIACLVVRAEEG